MKRAVVSACLGFARCRYDGRFSKRRVAVKRPGGIKYLPVCPEMAIGLGAPRPRVRLVVTARGPRLVQPSTGRDLTDRMRRFARTFMKRSGRADFFILKSRSPSCGIGDVKIYSSPSSRRPIGRSTGIFADEILKKKGVRNVKRI